MWGYYQQQQQRQPSQFVAQYIVLSTAVAGKDIDTGDKIYLPPSALDRLARMNVEYPMLFEVTNANATARTHCGVLEFSADEGYCYMPYWMMEKNLGVREQEIVTIKNVSLSKATFVKFKAKSVDFLEVTNPRAVLEVQLRKYTCLTVGDIIRIPHNRKFFDLEVKEVQPNGAASIIETDCNVDFDEPEGYQDSKYARYEKKAEAPAEPPKPRELQKAKLENEETEDSSSSNKFVPFSGAPKRIDGKIPPSVQQAKMSAPPVESKAESKSEKAETKDAAPVVPTYESRIGDKYSKKKVAVSAFGGTARKLDG